MNKEVVEIAAVLGLFIAVMTPLIIGIAYAVRENKRLNQINSAKKD